jgi:hypothetical protein
VAFGADIWEDHMHGSRGNDGGGLSDREVRELEAWVRSAMGWSESAQAMVAATTDLANKSRMLATTLAGRPPGWLSSPGDDGGEKLASDLRRLAETVEDDGRELRERFLQTEADLALYKDVLG